MAKIYPTNIYKSDNEQIVNCFAFLMKHMDENGTKEYQATHMIVSQFLRFVLETENVLGFGLFNDGKTAIVVEFDMPADGKYYEVKLDEDNTPYIEIED